MEKPFLKTMIITETGILSALGLVLAGIKFFQLPNGGSISFSSFPILLLTARRGTKAGIAGGLVFGFLSLIRRPFVVHPLQFFLDYPIAYATLGISGLIPWNSRVKMLGSILGGSSLRLICHFLAGVVFFSKPQDTIWAAVMISFTYNATFLIPEAILCFLLADQLRLKCPNLTERK
ncbi:MAG: energy-coupled thiamine transporter ThiT [Candidatus Riflebacteria bacterium]|nr:energy-coupled thiamine transporter ThiT [Candidatus Riflebacteria bacterium]